ELLAWSEAGLAALTTATVTTRTKVPRKNFIFSARFLSSDLPKSRVFLSRQISEFPYFLHVVSDRRTVPRRAAQLFWRRNLHQDRFLHVEPVLRLIENRLGVRLECLFVDLLSAVRRQTMHHHY